MFVLKVSAWTWMIIYEKGLFDFSNWKQPPDDKRQRFSRLVDLESPETHVMQAANFQNEWMGNDDLEHDGSLRWRKKLLPWQRAAKVCANLCAKKRARQAKTWWILLTNSVDAVVTSFCWNHWMLSCLWMVRSYRKGDPPRPGRPFCWCPGEVRKIWWCERWVGWSADICNKATCCDDVYMWYKCFYWMYLHYIYTNTYHIISYIYMIMYIVSIFSQFLQCRFPMYLLSSTPVNPILWMNPPPPKQKHWWNPE